MDTPEPGHFWKTPFLWEPGCPTPPTVGRLTFESAPTAWLPAAVAEVMTSSIDESDQFAVATSGAMPAAMELLAIAPEYFELRPDWWRLGRDSEGNVVGFVLPVLLKGEKAWRDGQPQGSIFYMGVLPRFRGNRYGRELLDEATRVFVGAGCWRIFCDMSSQNDPMLNAFRAAGYMERKPWQRPLS